MDETIPRNDDLATHPDILFAYLPSIRFLQPRKSYCVHRLRWYADLTIVLLNSDLLRDILQKTVVYSFW